MIDTIQPSASGFFDAFVGKNSVLIEPIVELEQIVRQASSSSTEEQSENLFSKAHKILLSSGFIVPLGQIDSIYYYPK